MKKFEVHAPVGGTADTTSASGPCQVCHGTGLSGAHKICGTCQGFGYVSSKKMECHRCKGTGFSGPHVVCDLCRGKGSLPMK